MKIAELKRTLTPGTKLRCVHNARGPVPPGEQHREVVSVSSANIVMRGMLNDRPTALSYLPMPKASELSSTRSGFRIEIAEKPHSVAVAIEYEWVHDTEGGAV